MRVHDQPRHFVVFVGNHLLRQEVREGKIGEGILRGHALLRRTRRQAGKRVAAAQRRCLGQQFAQIRKAVALIADTVCKSHASGYRVTRQVVPIPRKRAGKNPGIASFLGWT